MKINIRTHKSMLAIGYGLLMMFLITGVMQAAAQSQATPQQWTLRQCLEQALKSSPDVHATSADIQIAESQLAQAKAGRLPQATITSFTGIVNGTDGEGFAARTDDDDLGPFFKGELEVVQPLYTFGRLRYEIRAAMRGVETQQAASEKAQNAVIAAVKELYYNLLFSRQIHELLVEVHENFTKALETAEARLEAQEGNITQQDVLKLRIGLAGVTKERFTLERAIAVTREALKRQLSLSRHDPFAIADTRLTPVELQLQPLAEYLAQAGQHRPEIAQLNAGVAARKARLRAARSTYYPSFFLAGGVKGAVAPNRAKQESPFANDDFNFFRGGMALGLHWQLDFWMTQAKVKEHLAEMAKVQAQKQQAETGIGLDIQRNYLEVQENQQKLTAAQQARKAARALLVTTLANFNLGIGEAKEVFNNLGLYTRMSGDYYRVIRDLNITAAKLSQATGQEITTLTYQR